jgi:hypothetical protein
MKHWGLRGAMRHRDVEKDRSDGPRVVRARDTGEARVRLLSRRYGDQIQVFHSGEVTSGEVGGPSRRHHRAIEDHPAGRRTECRQLRMILVDTGPRDAAFPGHDRCTARGATTAAITRPAGTCAPSSSGTSSSGHVASGRWTTATPRGRCSSSARIPMTRRSARPASSPALAPRAAECSRRSSRLVTRGRHPHSLRAERQARTGSASRKAVVSSCQRSRPTR